MDREEVWIKRNACSFCNGSHLHTCTGYDCKEAVEKARGYYSRMAEGERSAQMKRDRMLLSVSLEIVANLTDKEIRDNPDYIRVTAKDAPEYILHSRDRPETPCP